MTNARVGVSSASETSTYQENRTEVQIDISFNEESFKMLLIENFKLRQENINQLREILRLEKERLNDASNCSYYSPLKVTG